MFITFQTVKRGNTRRCINKHSVTVKITSILSLRPTDMVTQVWRGEDDGEWKDVPLTRVEINKGDTFEELLVVGKYEKLLRNLDHFLYTNQDRVHNLADEFAIFT